MKLPWFFTAFGLLRRVLLLFLFACSPCFAEVERISFAENGAIEGGGIRLVSDGVETDLPEGSNIFTLLDDADEPFTLTDQLLHCDFFPANFIAESSNEQRIDLSGRWNALKWPFAGNEEDLIRNPGSAAGWEEVVMPGPVHLRDPDTPAPEDYHNVKFSHVDAEDGALLYRQLDVPSDLRMEGRVARLRLDGLYPRGAVYLNGQLLGVVETGLTPVEYDVTHFVTPGEALDVVIRLWRRGPYSRLDMPRWTIDYSGIHRAAYIKLIPRVHVDNLKIEQTLSDDMKSGVLKVRARVRNTSNTATDVSLDGVLPGADEKMSGSARLGAGARKWIELRATVPHVNAWSNERPDLYDLTMQLRSRGDDSVLQTFERRIGFRRFEMKDQRPLLNGRPVKIRGINFLPFVPGRGLAINKEEIRRELELMQKANINGIRTHLSGSVELAEVCDELGMFLIQEMPIDWAPDFIRDPEKIGGILLRLQGAVSRDRNHPSLLLWAVGNENLVSEEKNREIYVRHSHLFDRYIKALDPTRYTMFPPPGPSAGLRGLLSVDLGDIADIHYSFKTIRNFNETDTLKFCTSWEAKKAIQSSTREELVKGQWTGVWFSSEYHLFNGHPDLHEAGYLSYIEDAESWRVAETLDMMSSFRQRLNREWGYMEADPTCLGGAYFNWKDAAVGDQWGWTQFGERSSYGIVTPWLTPKPIWWIVRTAFAPVKAPKEVKIDEPGETVSFELDNQMSFTNLRECKVYARATEGGGNSQGRDVRLWHILHPDIPPNSRGMITVPLDREEKNFAAGTPVIIRLTFVDPKGFRIVTTDTRVKPAWGQGE